MRRTVYVLLGLSILLSLAAFAGEQKQDEKTAEESKLNSGTFAGLRLRNIGPALMSGRIGDVVIDHKDPATWYVAVCSGNAWKTTNAGTTWTPIFDNYGSYSIGCFAQDPNNHLVLWLGAGENNSQRSVGYGDGVYKSLDAGRSWKKVGLENSEHIAKILVDPRNSSVVYVAAQGPLWAPGGDRGLYKTTDGGETWQQVLQISENTGVTDIAFDPRNPDIVYAAAYQRRRHVWTLINGGPESGVYKSLDGGDNWKKINKGLPSVDRGRIGLAVPPMNPDVVYAIVEAAYDESGFFRSEDGGENWRKISDHVSGSPQYYQEIFADPHRFDVIYSLSTRSMVSKDGGRTWAALSNEWRHVDDHALAFFPDGPDHYLIGGDGGLYETFDGGETYRYFANLPVTQFYKVCVDNDVPFYNVYGGTQDNNTQGGPSRTNNVHGIRNSDWIITVGGDGFQPRVDPEDPNIVYSESQHGGLVRYDKRTGEQLDIRPQPEPGEDGPRWNWDSPLIISPHSHTRLYFAAQCVYRSDDRGDSWARISPDLSSGVDRNKLEVMGTVWSVDAVSKNRSTSFYGNIVSLSESPKQEGLIYAGTDDGLIHVTEDGGATWTKYDKFPGVPEATYVADLTASEHVADTVFAVFNNHKRGDFKPYVMRSDDRGKTWKSIAGDLPDRHIAWAIAQDHVREDLLFIGTEFAAFFTIDGGEHWVKLSGAPTIAVRDLEVQRRESDLACASFGRGFFILDDYSPLREVSLETLEQDAVIFPVKKTLVYIEADPFGGGEKASQGHGFFTAPNPPFGAVFTYYLKDSLSTRKAERKKQEAELRKEGKPVYYPTWEDLKAEDREEDPRIIITITDEGGNVVRRLTGPAGKGVQRVAWDLHYPAYALGGRRSASGPMAVPGKYQVSLAKYLDGEITPLVDPVPFETESLGIAALPARDRDAVLAFQKKTGELQRAFMGALGAAREADERIDAIRRALFDTPAADPALEARARELKYRLTDILEEMTGDPTLARRSEPTPPSLMSRLNTVIGGHWSTTSAPTATHLRQCEIVAEAFADILERLRLLVEVDLKVLEDDIEAAGAPWTPGRGVPKWSK